MKLIEALETLRQPAPEGSIGFRAFLACGFTPLDFKTFLTAHLRPRLRGRLVEITSAVYGDLVGSLERLSHNYDAVFVALEWADLDPRLGYRSSGSWAPDQLPELARNVEAALERLSIAIERIQSPIVLSLPTLPLSPAFYESPDVAGPILWRLEGALSQFAARASLKARIINRHALELASPVSGRMDLKADLSIGFPYTRSHADKLGEFFATVAVPNAPKKGIITDLDDTLWSGIVGEVGIDKIAWDLDHHAQVHGLYQKTLASLAGAGILVGIASKNDAKVVEQALGRSDLLVSASLLHPIEVNWGPKSESVSRILKAWNIAASDVVFVDDSPMELAEVQQAHPGIEVMQFPKDRPEGVLELLWTLRRRFGKDRILKEDKLRATSLQGDAIPVSGATAEDFLAQAQAVMVFDTSNPPPDERARELVNKTNQFNLNGRRYSATEWSRQLHEPGAFLVVVSYEDRFGPLGRIAVLAGRRIGAEALLDIWVMSCRAFSRRVEFASLDYLYEALGVNTITLDYQATERNGPLQDLLRTWFEADLTGPLHLSKDRFLQSRPALYHRTEVLSHA